MAVIPGDLRAVLAFSLRATIFDSAISSKESTHSSSPGRNKLVEGVLFSRSFILGYQGILLVLLLVFTIRHFIGRIRARKRQRLVHCLGRTTNGARLGEQNRVCAKEGSTLDAENAVGVPSSSSTIHGSSPSPKHSIMKRESEDTPLLAKSKTSSSISTTLQLKHQIRAFLLYQPRPIPLVNKILPPNGTTLIVLALLDLQIFFLFYRMPLSIPTLFVFADRASLLFVANLPLLYLFAAKNQPIKSLTGYSYESLNILHRRLGEVMCLLALLHSVCMIGVWYTILRPVGFGLARFLLSKIILLGIGALVAYELLYLTSLDSFRQRWYELFLVLHVSLQIAALVLLWFHHHGSRPYVGTALTIFLVDRLVYRMALKLETSRASLEVTKDGGTVVLCSEICLEQKHRSFGRLLGKGITKGWKATEHVFLTVPALSRMHFIQSHPFTIASKAPQGGDSEADLKLIIRAQDGFSGDLLRYAGRHNLVNVRFDGPYGSRSALHLLQQCDLAIIVAGGSGIAVALPLVRALHASRCASDLERCSKIKSAPRTVLIWVVRQETHTSWVGSAALQDLRESGIEVIIPPATADNEKPDVPSMITSCLAAKIANMTNATKTGVVCSGPDGMNRAVRNTCAVLSWQGNDIDVEIEKYGWCWTTQSSVCEIREKYPEISDCFCMGHHVINPFTAPRMEESISLLEQAGLNELLAPFDGSDGVQNLILLLQDTTSKLPPFLRRFQRWVDLSTRIVDSGHPPQQDLRRIFREFSKDISQYFEQLSLLSQTTYNRILMLQQDGLTDRDALAAMHRYLEDENWNLARLADIWLSLQYVSKGMLFGSPDDGAEPEDPIQPPTSPASDSGYQIMTEQAFAFHSTMTGGVTQRKPLLSRQTPDPGVAEPSTSCLSVVYNTLVRVLQQDLNAFLNASPETIHETLISACAHGLNEAAKDCLDRLKDMSYKIPPPLPASYVTPMQPALQAAVKNDHSSTVSLLLDEVLQTFLDHGWKINKKLGPTMAPPLSRAVEDLGLVRWFLANGANPNMAVRSWSSPLETAAMKAPLEVLELLVQYGGILHPSNALPTAAKMSISVPDRKNIIAYLLGHGVPINTIEFEHDQETFRRHGKRGFATALHNAAQCGDEQLVDYLLKRGARTDILDSKKKTALDYASKQNHGCVIALLEQNTKSTDGA
ncbi:MAG: hypothetical protein Q9213_006458 [Squamulea squamosa]